MPVPEPSGEEVEEPHDQATEDRRHDPPAPGVEAKPADAATTRVLLHDEATDQHGGFPAYGYPPEAALTVLPVAFSGWRLISLWVALCCSLLLLLIWRRRLPNQLLFLAWQLLGLSLLLSAFGWNPEYVAYLVLALSFARIDQVQVSAATLAIAVCANPLCWLAAPIYLAATHHEYAWRQRLNWFVGSCALGIIPWMIWDHHLLSQLLRFVTMPEFPLGAAIGQFSHLPNYGHTIYTPVSYTHLLKLVQDWALNPGSVRASCWQPSP